MRINFHPAMAEAVRAGEKSVTRRAWATRHAGHFRPGLIVDACSGRRPFAKLEIASVTWERNREMPWNDYWCEGFDFVYRNGGAVRPITVAGHEISPAGFEAWRDDGGWSWVVRFRRLDE